MSTEEEFNQGIAQRVRQAREAAGLSQAEAGTRLGLSAVGYGHYERATYAFTVWQLRELGRLLGQPVEHFVGLDTGLAPDEARLLAAYRALGSAQQRRLAVDMVRLIGRED
jgi:transcriptional regulator with XRE-family HTH domain